MIRVTIWNEHFQERGDEIARTLENTPENEQKRAWLIQGTEEIRKVHPNGISETLKSIFSDSEDIVVRTVTQDMPD